ncbi:winged helix-turn-helix domain-containing protein [Aliikangiella coralliicola]|uniref:Tetratricopeptide repeat protein n=1 Tax=Aliikangiella coralliicola TaxID=2592383 RepID=A0A545U7P2_9GAMM|nr:winged helix-turn-helix domain-containing protein [Aliikangiella coralliicola]TQV85478.1 tetratricopeptide repeat protein [Aliikangiella coralliicola]
MSNKSNVFWIADWLVEPDLVRLSAGDKQVTIRPKEMDLLVLLAEANGEVVTTQDILDKVWRDTAVNNDSIYYALSQLRKAFGDNRQQPAFIETIPKRGYRLLAQVRSFSDESDVTPDLSGKPDELPIESEENSFQTAQPNSKFSIKTWGSVIVLVASISLLLVKLIEFPSHKNSQANSPAPQSKSILPFNAIAVMPFDDLSIEGDQTYFSNGISDELMNQLARVKGLKVTARTSAYSLKNKSLSVPEIGKALNVGAVVEGSVRLDGQILRVTAQLIDANNGYQLWSKTYQRELNNIFNIQDEISRSIVSALLPELSNKADQLRPKSIPQLNTQAYLLYLKGLDAVKINTHQALEQSVEFFSTALEIEPGFANALTELAFAKLLLLETGASNDSGLRDQAKAHLDEAKRLSPKNGRIYSVLAKHSFFENEPENCAALFRKALELSPNDSESKAQLAMVLYANNKSNSEHLFYEAIKEDPFNDTIRLMYGHYLVKRGRITEALESIQRASEINPRNPNHLWRIAQLYMNQRGNIQQGIKVLETAAKMDRNDPELLYFMQLGYLTLGTLAPQEDLAILNHQKSTMINAFGALIESLYYLNHGREAEAMEAAKSIFDEDNVRFSHGSRELLIRIVTNQLLWLNKPLEAEQFLLTYSPEVRRFKDSPELSISKGAFPKKLRLRSLLSYANILKMLNKNDEYLALMNQMETVNLSYQRRHRDQLKARDYLIEAELLAIQGDNNGALEMLEKSVNKGFRFIWQLDILNNNAFRKINQETRFEQLIEYIQKDMQQQKLALLSP